MLSGKDVYEAITKNKPWADVWGAMTIHRQKIYNEAATILNSRIALLQELVRDEETLKQKAQETPLQG